MRKLFGRKKNGSYSQSEVTSQERQTQGHSSSQGSGNPVPDNETPPGGPFQLRGDQLARDNDYNGAIVMYDAAILDAPHDRNLLLSRSIAHSRATPSRLDLALKDADEALTLNPRWWEAWFQKGKFLFRIGNFQSAEEALTNAAGFAHSADKAKVQEVLHEVRAYQVESQVQSLSLESTPPLSAPSVQPQRMTQQPTVTPDQHTAALPSEPPSYDESQAMDRAAPLGANDASEKPRDIKNETKHKPTFDHEAMMAKLIPADPNLQTLEESNHTWHIRFWKDLSQKEYGPIFECGGSPWQIFIFPNGNNINYVSLYFQHGYGEGKVPENWYRCIQFAIVMWNPTTPSKYVSSAAKHRFNADEDDWGFTKFCDLQKLKESPWDGHDSPLIDDDEVNITAYVRVVKDPTGVLWHNFLNYDSKKETGMVGLKNQGATGYLNAVLQTLYFTNSLRKTIYQIPSQENAKTDIVWALQRLFYALQTSHTAVCTRELTASFGWSPLQAFEQQDMKEMSAILVDRLDTVLQRTPMKRALPEIFGGSTKQYINSAGHESSMTESLWHIDLEANNCFSLDESFKDYIRSEKLPGDKQGGSRGLQDTEMVTTFTHFPPVLQLYLKRIQYDIKSDSLIKTNTHFEYPEEFDTSSYLSPGTDRSEPWTYRLVGVTVHSGNMDRGQYYTFRRPTKDGPFYKFDDQIVSRATLREVMNDNFGGESSRLGGQVGVNRTYSAAQERSRNAYMLVYVRKSRLDEVLVDVKEEDVPEHIRNQAARESVELAKKRKTERKDPLQDLAQY